MKCQPVSEEEEEDEDEKFIEKFTRSAEREDFVKVLSHGSSKCKFIYYTEQSYKISLGSRI